MPNYLCWSEDKPTHSWCSYQAIDNYTIIVQYIYLSTLALFSLIFLRYWLKIYKTALKNTRNRLQSRQQNQSSFKLILYMVRNYTDVQVFAIVFGWLLCSVVKSSINIGVYMGYMRGDFGDGGANGDRQGLEWMRGKQWGQEGLVDREAGEPIVILSAIFLFLDYMSGVFLIFVMFLIPYKWQFFVQSRLRTILLNTSQKQKINDQVRKKIDFFFTLLKGIKIYTWIMMILFPTFLLIQPFLLFFTEYGCDMRLYNGYFFYFQSTLTLIFYLFSALIVSFIHSHSLLSISPKHFSRIRLEYFLLLSVLVIRMGLNYFFKLSDFYQYAPNQNCSDRRNRIKATVFLVVASFVMHLLPIGVIIGVYRPGGEKEGEGDGDGGNASGSEGGGKGKGWKGKNKGRSGSFETVITHTYSEQNCSANKDKEKDMGGTRETGDASGSYGNILINNSYDKSKQIDSRQLLLQ